ncbi:hypothetical protein [Vallicoccus soli]|uniref:Uncharacterized protein n=1 Tax=Vallicoccus soli TaxID=2339232 RepID=A0A3A3Z0P7_9ACTN|nr:hypothetical protein [Vallicoccus soli]RJK97830.1 hypothetical protein D5H78_02300 [Vallicoccus soli]
MHHHRLGGRVTTRAGALALAAGLALTGCGSDESGGAAGEEAAPTGDAKATVEQALTGVYDATSMSMTMKLDGTVEDFTALDPESPMDAEDRRVLEQVLAGDVVYAVTAPEGKTLADTAQAQQLGAADLADPEKLKAALAQTGSFSMAVNLDGSALGELRFVDATLFAQADVPRIAELAGEDTAQLEAMAAQLPPALAPLQKGLQGEWVGVDLDETIDAAANLGLFQQLQQGAAGAPTPDPTAAAGLLQSLRTAYDEHVTVEEVDGGDRGDGYRLTAPLREVAGELADDLQRLGGTQGADLTEDLQQVPDRDVTVDVFVEDGELTGMVLPLGQFAEDGPVESDAVVDVAVDTGAEPVTAPEGANLIDVSQALLSFGGMMNRPS